MNHNEFAKTKTDPLERAIRWYKPKLKNVTAELEELKEVVNITAENAEFWKERAEASIEADKFVHKELDDAKKKISKLSSKLFAAELNGKIDDILPQEEVQEFVEYTSLPVQVSANKKPKTNKSDILVGIMLFVILILSVGFALSTLL